jgi:hypothetical protein
MQGGKPSNALAEYIKSLFLPESDAAKSDEVGRLKDKVLLRYPKIDFERVEFLIGWLELQAKHFKVEITAKIRAELPAEFQGETWFGLLSESVQSGGKGMCELLDHLLGVTPFSHEILWLLMEADLCGGVKFLEMKEGLSDD